MSQPISRSVAWAAGVGLALSLGSASAGVARPPAPAGVTAAASQPARTGGVRRPLAQASSTSPGGVTVWPQPARAGDDVVVELADPRARTAATLVVCARPPGKASQCRTAARRTEARRTAVALHVGRVGVWRIELRPAGGLPLAPGALDVVRSVRVDGGRLHLLATGDSEIQGIDDMLAAGLPSTRVTGEAHISTGLSKPAMFDWIARAAAQARSIRSDITAVYIGANDGFAVPDRLGRLVNCCGAAWVGGFAVRAESMMASYLRGGAGRVFWFTLPAPRDRAAAPIFRAINRAYRIAARSFPFGVQLIDLGTVFTPGGRYRDAMEYHGRYVTVREPDGYHLSPAGDRIATSILIGDLRADRLIG